MIATQMISGDILSSQQWKNIQVAIKNQLNVFSLVFFLLYEMFSQGF